MSENKDKSVLPKGGSFLLEPLGAHKIYIPEQASADEKSLAQLTRDFSQKEVLSQSEAIERNDQQTVPALLKKAGELGLLMSEVPASFGGLGLGKVPTTFIAENISYQGSFSVSFMCHTGIGTLPIDAFGTTEQKQKYLPKLASGEMIAAYSLSEMGSGSDALGAKTTAVLSDDGKHYILNGEKAWVTNGGFADLYTIFAKVDGEKFTAFIVERDTPGLKIEKEEDKLGIKGSSTTVLVLDNLKVPVENVLGEIGKGHYVAFNVLNVGRWKLGAATVGACKRLVEHMSKYVKERKQFAKSLSEFQLIRDKVATAGVLTYLNESIVYRYAHLIDEARAGLAEDDADYNTKRMNIMKEYSIEASISKVYGSEALDTVADEAVQSFGGFGYSEEYPVAQFYRDSRINRIFEGTNEINRLIITGNLLKSAMKGDLPLMQRLQEILGGLKAGFAADETGLLAQEANILAALKRMAVYVAGVAVQKYQQKIDDQQSIIAFIADAIIQVFALESGIIRARMLQEMSQPTEVAEAICKVATAEQQSLLFARARQVLMNIADDEKEFEPYSKALHRLTLPCFVDTFAEREKVAAHMLAVQRYEIL